jgi:hypothetical protein
MYGLGVYFANNSAKSNYYLLILGDTYVKPKNVTKNRRM